MQAQSSARKGLWQLWQLYEEIRQRGDFPWQVTSQITLCSANLLGTLPTLPQLRFGS